MNKVCNLCPRLCKIDRDKNFGFCKSGKKAKIVKVMKHFWEEPIISGTDDTLKKGSGTIFFSGCNLRCVYCQNYEISHGNLGKEYSTDDLVTLFKKIENSGATNINFVTPTHFTDEILKALKTYKPHIPIVWNTNGYESVETIEKLKGYVDIFLTDLKYYSSEVSKKYSNCEDYFEKTSKAIMQMRKNCPQDIIKNGLMEKGIIIRHLILPNNYKDSFKILEWIKENLGTITYISIMGQYVPCDKAEKYPEINRKLKPLEYNLVLRKFCDLDFKNGFSQDLKSATTDFIPDFNIEEEL